MNARLERTKKYFEVFIDGTQTIIHKKRIYCIVLILRKKENIYEPFKKIQLTDFIKGDKLLSSLQHDKSCSPNILIDNFVIPEQFKNYERRLIDFRIKKAIYVDGSNEINKEMFSCKPWKNINN